MKKHYLSAVLILSLGGFSLAENLVAQPAFGQEESEKALQLRIEAEPTTAVHHYNLATYWLQQQAFEAAEAEYLQALKLDPYFVPAYNNLGSLYLLQGKNDRAEKLFSQALLFWKTDPELYYNLALALEKQQKTQPTIAALQKALSFQSLDPERTDAISASLRTLLQQPEGRPPANINSATRLKQIQQLLAENKLDQAQTSLLQWVNQEPNHALPYDYLAQLSAKRKNTAQAVLWLRQAVQLSPERPEIAFRLGQSLYWQGNFSEALDILKTHAQNHSPSLLLRSEIYLKQAAFDQAESLLSLARQKWPQEQAVLLSQAELDYLKQDFTKSQLSLDQITAPTTRASQRFMQIQAAVYLHEGQAQAIPYLEQLYRAKPSQQLGRSLAEAYLNAGRFQDALKMSQKHDSAQDYLQLQTLLKQRPFPASKGRYGQVKPL